MLRFMVSHILVVDPTVHLSKRPTVIASSGRLSSPTGCGGGEECRPSSLFVNL